MWNYEKVAYLQKNLNSFINLTNNSVFSFISSFCLRKEVVAVNFVTGSQSSVTVSLSISITIFFYYKNGRFSRRKEKWSLKNLLCHPAQGFKSYLDPTSSAKPFNLEWRQNPDQWKYELNMHDWADVRSRRSPTLVSNH